MKKLSTLILISIATLFLFSCATTSSKENPSEEQEKVTIPAETKTEKSKSNKPSEKIITETEYYLETELKIPVFKGYDLLNSYIENSEMNYYKSFKVNSKNDYDNLLEERKLETDPYEMNKFQYTTEYDYSITEDYISVILYTWIWEGGAHGNTSLQTFCYNKNTSSFEYDLEALSGLTYDEIASICQHQLVKDYGDQTNFDWIMEGTSSPSAFEYFLVKDKCIEINFEHYSVGPYSMGIPAVEIPKK